MWSADLHAALRLEVMLNLLFFIETAIFEGLTLDCICSGCVLEHLHMPNSCVNTLSKSKAIALLFRFESQFSGNFGPEGADVLQACKC